MIKQGHVGTTKKGQEAETGLAVISWLVYCAKGKEER